MSKERKLGGGLFGLGVIHIRIDKKLVQVGISADDGKEAGAGKHKACDNVVRLITLDNELISELKTRQHFATDTLELGQGELVKLDILLSLVFVSVLVRGVDRSTLALAAIPSEDEMGGVEIFGQCVKLIHEIENHLSFHFVVAEVTTL